MRCKPVPICIWCKRRRCERRADDGKRVRRQSRRRAWASKVYAARPRRPVAARGATQLQLKAHPAPLLPQPARPPTHPLRLMRRALLKGEKA